MRTRLWIVPWIVPLLTLGLAALACNSVLPAGTVLFKDDFADASGEWKYADGTLFRDGRLVVLNDEQSTIVPTVIDEPGLANIRVEVSGQNTSSAKDEVFGLVCYFSARNGQASYYLLGIGTDGYYTIGRYTQGELTTLIEGTGSKFTDENATYRLAAECRRGSQALYVDGKVVASATDSSLANGDVGLFVGSYKVAPAAATFDDFVVTQLK